MPNYDGAILARHIMDILEKINRPMTHFDFIYESIN